MEKNQIIELEIESMSFGPSAVGRIALPGSERPMVVFVEGAAPGERVRARLLRGHKSYWEARLVEVLRPSADRVTPPCPSFPRFDHPESSRNDHCGGCQWQHLSYEAQLRAKTEILLHQLSRATRLDAAELRGRLKVHGAKSPFGYRARLQAHGDKRGLGFFAAGSHRVVPTEKCLVAHPDIQQAWSRFTAQPGLMADLAAPTGSFKIEWTRAENGQVREAINRKHGAFGFTQVNPEQNEILRNVVAELARGSAHKRTLFDLFGGDGNLSRNPALGFERVLCVDSNNEGRHPAEIGDASPSGQLLLRSGVEEFLADQRWLDWGIREIDCVIADPPRNGMGELAAAIARLQAPRMILVSCDPSTLARDLTAFLPHYQIDQIHLIDMFPQTFHMEIVIGCSSSRHPS